MVALALGLLLPASAFAADPACPAAAAAGAAFEARLEGARACARDAYLAGTPVLQALPLDELRRLPGAGSGDASVRRRELVLGLIDGIEAARRLQTPGAAGDRTAWLAIAKEKLGLPDGAVAGAVPTSAPRRYGAASEALARARGEGTALASGPSVAASASPAPRTSAAAGVRPAAGPRAGRAAPPPDPLARNARVDAAFERDYDRSSLPFKDASEHWLRERDSEPRDGESAAAFVGRRTAAALAGPPMDWLAQLERKAQQLAYRASDPDYSRAAAASSLKPDGFGITVFSAKDGSRRAFRDPAEAERFLASLPDGAARRIVFYGHGAPGMQTVGEDRLLGADDIVRLAQGRVRAGGRVDLVGCNTASIGSRAFEGPDAVGASLYGLATLARRLTYYSMARFAGGVDKETAERGWNEDLAMQVSARLPGVEVSGMRTFAIPLDRLIPGADSPTPSEYVIGRRAVYLNGREL